MPEGPWPLLTDLALTAPTTYYPLLMPGELAQGLPCLSSLHLDHPGLQSWTKRQLSVTSLVLRTVRTMGRAFQELLKCLPNLRSLEVCSDSGFFPFDNRPPLLAPVALNHLERLKVHSSRFRLLRRFKAPSLRHFEYQATSESHYDVHDSAQLSDIYQFKVQSDLATCLETLTVKVDPRLSTLASSMSYIVDGLSKLHTLELWLGTAEAYQRLYDHEDTSPLDVPSLTTARFCVVDDASARAVVRFTELYPAVLSVSVQATWDPRAHCSTVFESPLAKAQGWSRVGPVHYRLDRLASL